MSSTLQIVATSICPSVCLSIYCHHSGVGRPPRCLVCYATISFFILVVCLKRKKNFLKYSDPGFLFYCADDLQDLNIAQTQIRQPSRHQALLPHIKSGCDCARYTTKPRPSVWTGNATISSVTQHESQQRAHVQMQPAAATSTVWGPGSPLCYRRRNNRVCVCVCV